MSLPPVFRFTRSTNAGGKLRSCPKSIPIFFIGALLWFRAKPEAKSRKRLELQTSARDVSNFAQHDATSRIVDSQWHRAFMPGALREERNEAGLCILSREACLNRSVRPIR